VAHGIDPQRVIRILHSNFTLDELISVCEQLGMDPSEFHFGHSKLKARACIVFVAELFRTNRLDEMIEVAKQIRPDAFESLSIAAATSGWIAKQISPDVVAAVDELLGFAGTPHHVLVHAVANNNPAPEFDQVATGCYCWRLPTHMTSSDRIGAGESLDWLERVRHLVASDEAIAFIGTDSEATNLGIVPARAIVVGASDNHLDAIRIEQTTADSHALWPADLMSELGSLSAQFDIDLIAADQGSLIFRVANDLDEQQLSDLIAWLVRLAPDAFPSENEVLPGFDPTRVELWWD
jgi:hypothetical protein